MLKYSLDWAQILIGIVCSPYFGHSVSFTSEQELYRWLSAMLHAQVHTKRHSYRHFQIIVYVYLCYPVGFGAHFYRWAALTWCPANLLKAPCLRAHMMFEHHVTIWILLLCGYYYYYCTVLYVAWTMLSQNARLSVTCRYSTEMVKHIIKLFAPLGSHTIMWHWISERYLVSMEY